MSPQGQGFQILPSLWGHIIEFTRTHTHKHTHAHTVRVGH